MRREGKAAKIASRFMLAVLVVTVALTTFGFNPARATIPSVSNLSTASSCNGTSPTLLTTCTRNYTWSAGFLYTTIYAKIFIAAPAAGVTISSVSDGTFNWKKAASIQTINPFGGTFPFGDYEIWYVVINGTALAGTVTVTATASSGFWSGAMTIGQLSGQFYPLTSIDPTPTVTQTSSTVTGGTYTISTTAPSVPAGSIVTMFTGAPFGTCTANCNSGTVTMAFPTGGLAVVSSEGGVSGDGAVGLFGPCGEVGNAAPHCALNFNTGSYYTTNSQTGQAMSASFTVAPPSATFYDFMQMVVIWNPNPQAASTAGSGQGVIGQCPLKNTATVTLANNTEYFYTGSTLNPMTISSVSTFVAQVTSATAPQTLSLGIYVTQNAGAIGAGNTFFLVAAFSKSLTAGTTNNAISWSPGLSLSGTLIGAIPSQATIGVALLGTSKIKINQSSLAGLSTGATSGGVLASTFTSLSASGSQLYLCMNYNYQSIATSTTTTTTTTTSTTTNTVTTAGGGSTPSSFITNPQTPVLFLVLLLPTVVLLFISRNVVGALVGLGIGSVIGVSAGVLDKFLFFALIIGIVAAAFLARNRD